jgi:hypothetical protein
LKGEEGKFFFSIIGVHSKGLEFYTSSSICFAFSAFCGLVVVSYGSNVIRSCGSAFGEPA